jgi:uncharacterized protein (DUF433 family)
MGTLRKHSSLRPKPDVAEALAERFVTEGLPMDRHPGIVFRQGAAGRRASLAGRRLDVWQIIETLRDSGGDEAEAAMYLGLTPAQVHSAVGYQTEFADEIDGWIDRNANAADQAEAVWRREQATAH